ncbi:DUF3515 domain-containing protein [Corynebacterium sp. UBA2622]|uniref:DUF3515 domain-containing protein n=1 Tax=Corynebacterium sp. UBA2622 TaxID=1946393 RepID=UPI0025C14431|nr:DUF3515 domain-containing protein [Corynebacterium sp. UBA2622]
MRDMDEDSRTPHAGRADEDWVTEAAELAEEEENESQLSRKLIYALLGLALVLVAGVLVGVKIFYDRVALQPVAMADVASPEAGSQECTQLIDALPATLLGHRRAELAEPAPQGAAAWQSSSTQRVTLRCGVDAPLQYNEYTPTEEAAGARWMRVDDATPGSSMTTWYTVDRSPVVAVTSDEAALNGRSPLDKLDLSSLHHQDVAPAPAPLSALSAGPAEHCDALLADLPDSPAEGFTRLGADRVRTPGTAVWVARGREPIVVRCGVADPENYRPGVELYQVNDVTWFEDTTLANGTTSATWFALGRTANVAANLPQSEGNAAVTALSEAIARNVPER